MKRTILSPLSSLSLSPASLFSLSHTLNLSTLPHFFPSDAPQLLSIHFISLQFFGAISPLIPRLSLMPVSPGFLSPAEGGGGGAGTEQKKKEHRGEELGQEAVDDTHAHAVAMVTGRLAGILWNEYLYVTRPMASSDI